MRATTTPLSDERQLAKHEDRTGSAHDYVPPRVEKTQKLAEVTGAAKVTGVAGAA